jgi:hypothetical protein
MMTGLLSLVIYIVVLGIVVWLCLWILDMIPLPPPFGQVAKVIVMVVAVLILCELLLSLVGGGGGIHLGSK